MSYKWDTAAVSVRPTALQMLLAEYGGARLPISFGDAFSQHTNNISSFFSIAGTKFGRVPRLNELRLRARRCFLAVFLVAVLRRLTMCEGVLHMRVADRKLVDETAIIQLPDASRMQLLPDTVQQRFRHLAILRLRLIFQPILLRRLMRKRLAEIFNATYKDSMPPPTAEDLKLASPFFQLFPTAALERLVANGTRRVYLRGMWVGAPRSERSAARCAVNSGSAESTLSKLLPQLASSGVLPAITPALHSAFIVLHGSVVDLGAVPGASAAGGGSAGAGGGGVAMSASSGARLGGHPGNHPQRQQECSIGGCIGETVAFAEGGVDGRGFKVQSATALTWEIDVMAIAEVIGGLMNPTTPPSPSVVQARRGTLSPTPSFTGGSAPLLVPSLSSGSLTSHHSHHNNNNHNTNATVVTMSASMRHHSNSGVASAAAAAAAAARDAILQFIVEKRIRIMTEHFRPTISNVQNWTIFRGCTTAVDVTTHILPRLVPRIFFAGTCIVGPESGEVDRGVYFVARGRVAAQGAAAVERGSEEWQSFGEYEGYFNESYDLSFHARTVVDCWVLPRPVIQSIAKIPYLRPDMILLGLQMREALMRRCGPVRDVIEHMLVNQFLGGQKFLHPLIVETVIKVLTPKVYPAGERCITAGEDEKTCLFFVRGKLNQSSAHGFIAHNPPFLYGPHSLHGMLDPNQCAAVGPVLSSWKLSLVAVRNVECWTVPAAKLHAALKIFFETCDLPAHVLVSKTPIPGSAGAAAALGHNMTRTTSSSQQLVARHVTSGVSSHDLLNNNSSHPNHHHHHHASRLARESIVSFHNHLESPTRDRSKARRESTTAGPAVPASITLKSSNNNKNNDNNGHSQQKQQPQPQQRPRSASSAVAQQGTDKNATGKPAAAAAPPGYVRATNGKLYRGPPTLRTASAGAERVAEMKMACQRDFEANMQGPAINAEWSVESMPVPPRSSARRMADLDCLGQQLGTPDKRMLLLLRRLPQTPRVHGKGATEFDATRFVRQSGKLSLGSEGQKQQPTLQQQRNMEMKEEKMLAKAAEKANNSAAAGNRRGLTSVAAGGSPAGADSVFSSGIFAVADQANGNNSSNNRQQQEMLTNSIGAAKSTVSSHLLMKEESNLMSSMLNSTNNNRTGAASKIPPVPPGTERTVSALDSVILRQQMYSARTKAAKKDELKYLAEAATELALAAAEAEKRRSKQKQQNAAASSQPPHIRIEGASSLSLRQQLEAGALDDDAFFDEAAEVIAAGESMMRGK